MIVKYCTNILVLIYFYLYFIMIDLIIKEAKYIKTTFFYVLVPFIYIFWTHSQMVNKYL